MIVVLMVHNMMMMGKGPRAWIQLGFCLGLVLLLVGRGGECAGEASVESASGDSWWGSFWEDLIPEGWKGMFKRGSQKEGTQVLSEAEILKLEAPRTGFVAAVRVKQGHVPHCEVRGELYYGSVRCKGVQGW